MLKEKKEKKKKESKHPCNINRIYGVQSSNKMLP